MGVQQSLVAPTENQKNRFLGACLPRAACSPSVNSADICEASRGPGWSHYNPGEVRTWGIAWTPEARVRAWANFSFCLACPGPLFSGLFNVTSEQTQFNHKLGAQLEPLQYPWWPLGALSLVLSFR